VVSPDAVADDMPVILCAPPQDRMGSESRWAGWEFGENSAGPGPGRAHTSGTCAPSPVVAEGRGGAVEAPARLTIPDLPSRHRSPRGDSPLDSMLRRHGADNHSTRRYLDARAYLHVRLDEDPGSESCPIADAHLARGHAAGSCRDVRSEDVVMIEGVVRG
jgi:hypothetical protein